MSNKLMEMMIENQQINQMNNLNSQFANVNQIQAKIFKLMKARLIKTNLYPSYLTIAHAPIQKEKNISKLSIIGKIKLPLKRKLFLSKVLHLKN